MASFFTFHGLKSTMNREDLQCVGVTDKKSVEMIGQYRPDWYIVLASEKPGFLENFMLNFLVKPRSHTKFKVYLGDYLPLP